jgi:hypothetical protein
LQVGDKVYWFHPTYNNPNSSGIHLTGIVTQVLDTHIHLGMNEHDSELWQIIRNNQWIGYGKTNKRFDCVLYVDQWDTHIIQNEAHINWEGAFDCPENW